MIGRLLRISAALLGGLLAATAAMAQTVPPAVNLTAADVGQIIAQAANEAVGRGVAATIAVTDRVGNVLGVFRMNGAATAIRVNSDKGIPVGNGLEQLDLPDTLVAIAKAITGAYLSSNGNAFTTRTASQIVQEHFNVGEFNQPGGPLYGVQFSQLPCSDLVQRFGALSGLTGPKRSPLGLSADPGGLPIYKNGVHAGGIGVISDAKYGLDLNIRDVDTDNDELIAVAGTVGFDTPDDIKGSRITVDGKTFRFVDRGREALNRNPAAAPAFGAITGGVVGSLVPVPLYFAGALIDGAAYGTVASGYAPITIDNVSAVGLFNGAGAQRFTPIAGSEAPGTALTVNEVTKIIGNALRVAYSGRAQIRRPLGTSFIEVTVSVVDTTGAVLGVARTVDAPVFGTDVSLQKARSALFFSSPGTATIPSAAAALNAAGQGAFVTAMQNYTGPTALADGRAFGDRSVGNFHRPFFPDGIRAGPNGPLSTPIGTWSPFNVGLQLNLIAADVLNHVLFIAGTAGAADSNMFCAGPYAAPQPFTAPGLPLGQPLRLGNGLQIFAGGVPIFRGRTLVGGIGISGDGIDQDDMVAFLGLHRAGIELATGVGNAPQDLRIDREPITGSRVRYVSCPQAPFLNSSEQNPCEGK
jgi:uncharacterized protein GlcG (DUF336 family)